VPVAEFSNTPAPAPTPAPTPVESAPEVTTATPELAPAGIDKAAVTESTVTPAEDASSTLDAQTLDALLGNTPVVKDVVEFDPTKLIDHPGNLAELGLDYGWGMTTVFEKLMETIYLQSGWGWAGTIVATTVVVRSGLFVFQALSSDKMAGMAALKPVTGPLQEKLNAAIKAGNSREVDLLKMQQAAVLKPYTGGILMTGTFAVAQAYVGFCAFRLLRAMGELPVPGMVNDGFLWFTDLSVRDPYFILPAATTGIMYMVFKVCLSPPPYPSKADIAHRTVERLE
jgi:YidC/Oxa1 family membrane protein insertase